MAERRMFAKSIVDSDAFLDMPLSAQALYFHLSMRADDDGFVNNPKKITKILGTTDDDFKLLLVKKFLLIFESGIIVVKHWKIHNYIRSDRYNETNYKEEKASLLLDENNAYTLSDKVLGSGIPHVIPHVIPLVDTGKDRLGKDRLGKDIFKQQQKKFIKPLVEDIQAYCLERKNGIDAQHFYDYYQSKGWLIGKTPMKDWRAAVRTWETNKKKDTPIEQERPYNAML